MTGIIENCPTCRTPLDVHGTGITSEGYPSTRSNCKNCGQRVTSIIPNRPEGY
jgi:hypothetical protein